MLDLDVDSPEKLPGILRLAAQRFYESAGELEAAWQDKNAGKVWTRFARILERSADSCERVTQ